MTSVGNYYGTIDTAFAFGNEDTQGVTEYAQFNTLVTNKFFTPDNEPEDLQFRISKDVKFFLGSNDTNARLGPWVPTKTVVNFYPRACC